MRNEKVPEVVIAKMWASKATASGQSYRASQRSTRVKHFWLSLSVACTALLLSGCGSRKSGEIVVDLEDLSNIPAQINKLSPGGGEVVSNIATLKVVRGQAFVFRAPLDSILFTAGNPAINHKFVLQNLRSVEFDQIEMSVLNLGPGRMGVQGPREEWRKLDCTKVDCLKESKAVRMDRSYPHELRLTDLALRGPLKSGQPYELILTSSVLNNPNKIYAEIDFTDDQAWFRQ
jgi:hypothetical protein